MPRLATPFRNLPIRWKITLCTALILVAAFAGAGFTAYRSLVDDLEHTLGSRLEHIARTAALLIPADQHQMILQGYLAQDKELTQRPYFKNLQKILKKVQTQNDLVSDVYTVIKPDWDKDTMIFVAMGSDKPYVGNGMPMNPAALKALQEGIPNNTGLYRDKEGVWISALAPIRDAHEKVVAAIEVDYRADSEVAAAKLQLLKNLLFPVLGGLFFSILFGAIMGTALARPVRELALAAREISSGNLDVHVKNDSQDEIGVLAATFNEMTAALKASRQALEAYASTLEIKVAERTRELRDANEAITAMVNSLGQGFLVFDKEGKCLPVRSKACETLLQMNPQSSDIGQILRREDSDFRNWCEMLFQEPIPFPDLALLGPATFPHSDGKHISLEYHPIRGERAEIRGVVVVASDKTKEQEAIRRAQSEHAYANSVIRITRNREQFGLFCQEARQALGILHARLENPSFEGDIDLALRLTHTLKGGASVFFLEDLKNIAHAFESRLAELRTASPENRRAALPELRSAAQKIGLELDAFWRRNRELLGRDRDSQEGRWLEIPLVRFKSFLRDLQRLEHSDGLQREFVASFLEEPIGRFFKHYEEVVQDIAGRQGKEIAAITWHGTELPVVAEPYRELFLSFVHAFRNAVDHGVETPEERLASGKGRAARLSVSFTREERSALLQIVLEDDGRGISTESLRSRARQQGREEWARAASDEAILQSLFENGVTTAATVTEWSGRGVGLDAIRAAAQALGGTATLRSSLGKGTRLEVSVPDRLGERAILEGDFSGPAKRAAA